jgi:hypothetical protein
LKIELDETEITHILDALGARINDLTDTLAMAGDPEIEDEIAALEELSFDLFESLHRDDDGWGRENDAVPDAAAEFIQAGIDTREQVKASSRAAERRIERTMVSTGSAVSNDPIDW